jgi:hypothetical protein
MMMIDAILVVERYLVTEMHEAQTHDKITLPTFIMKKKSRERTKNKKGISSEYRFSAKNMRQGSNHYRIQTEP